jgi:hypothetical protein
MSVVKIAVVILLLINYSLSFRLTRFDDKFEQLFQDQDKFEQLFQDQDEVLADAVQNDIPAWQTAPALPACRDNRDDCPLYAKYGYCASVRSYCDKSCKFCKEEEEESPSQLEACIKDTNSYRAKHQNTPSLQWDSDLADKAQKWAERLVELERMEHSYVKGEGENIYYIKDEFPATCEKANEAWYNEIKDYDYATPGFSGATGYFTQFVWKATTKFGLGIATSSRDEKGFVTTFIVAKYTPQGNFYMRGKEKQAFTDNVQPRKGK